MTRGWMASGKVAVLIWSLKPCVLLPADLLTSEGATETTLPPVSIATPNHTATVLSNDPRSASTQIELRTAIHLGHAALGLQP